MKTPRHRLSDLSPDKRRLFLRALERKGLAQREGTGVPRRAGDGPPPLSFAQQRLWFFDQLLPGDPAYNDSYAIRLEGALDADALRRSLSDVVRRHEALRTTFRLADDGPVQVVHEPRDVTLPVEDRTADAGADPDPVIQRTMLALASEPFDLAAGPLLRARLLRLGAEDHVLLLVLHHIVSDGASYCILFKELAETYAALASGAEPPLAAPPIRFADYAAWERARLTEESMRPHLDYWRERLAGPPPKIRLESDRPRPEVQSFRGAGRVWSLPDEVASAVLATGRNHDATLFMVLHAAFQLLLRHETGATDVCCGFAMSTRDAPETRDLIGFFVNTLALRCDLSGDPPFAEIVRRTRRACLDAYEHREVPFERIVQELDLPRTLDQNPLFQVFAVHYSHPRPIELPGLRLSYYDVDYGVTRFDLEMWITDDAGLSPTETGGGPARTGDLAVNFQYNRDLFDEATIDRLLRRFASIVRHATADDALRASELTSRMLADERGDARDGRARRRKGALDKLKAARRARVGGASNGGEAR